MTDSEFARAFEEGRIAPDDFNHRAHLRLAWVYLNESVSTEEATSKMATAIRRFAASVGKPDKYSDAITEFWMRTLADARHALRDVTFSALLDAHPGLLDARVTLK